MILRIYQLFSLCVQWVFWKMTKHWQMQHCKNLAKCRRIQFVSRDLVPYYPLLNFCFFLFTVTKFLTHYLFLRQE